MSDLTEWIKERRAIHDAATEGPWKARPGNEIEGGRGDSLMGGDADYFSGFMLHGEDADSIVDAHNTLPALLTAVENVLEVISKIDREHSKAPGDDAYADGMCDAAYLFDTALSEAIEGAIK